MLQIQVVFASVLFAGQLLVYCHSTSFNVCSREPPGIKVSLSSQKNAIGHWITQVNFERGGGQGFVEALRNDLWLLDVNSNTKSCKGAGSSLDVTLNIQAPLPQLRPDYELFPGFGFYKFHDVATTWPLARKICDDEDAHLIILNSEMEADIVKTLFARHPTITGAESIDYLWTGVERKNGDYWTIYGYPLNSTGFMRWDPGQPKKREKHFCLVISRETRGLLDTIYDSKFGFICEHEL